MSKNWFHKLLPARFVLHSQPYPRVNITCLVPSACAACRATRYPTMPAWPAGQCAKPLSCEQASLLSTVAIKNSAQISLRRLHHFAFSTASRYRELICTPSKTLGVSHRQRWPRLTAVKEACLQERSSCTLLALQAESRRAKKSAPQPHGTPRACDTLCTTPPGPLHHLACTLSPYVCTVPQF